MSFTEAVRSCFTQYVGFTGRASRAEFWWFVLFSILVTFVTGFVDAAVFGYGWGDPEPISTVASIALLLPTIAVGARRLHDTGRSGWWQLLWLIPCVGWIPLVIWWCQRSDHLHNEHGYPWVAPAR
ncbi:DUF805 domain-containing protein [Nocardioides sp. GY 10113]|uniref:DUF805 domain-containing protein n=1 Tax=Nocardioides sp. GY 10113 TaxID=2569761 RepID=UPI0010A86D21|nr:DUF805 domain-containing protein [Nocardioides sp. GY 10113]TIC87580.1 DUF805 domain-containing protein [Nocardioides sp. GY 10113]